MDEVDQRLPDLGREHQGEDGHADHHRIDQRQHQQPGIQQGREPQPERDIGQGGEDQRGGGPGAPGEVGAPIDAGLDQTEGDGRDRYQDQGRAGCQQRRREEAAEVDGRARSAHQEEAEAVLGGIARDQVERRTGRPQPGEDGEHQPGEGGQRDVVLGQVAGPDGAAGLALHGGGRFLVQHRAQHPAGSGLDQHPGDGSRLAIAEEPAVHPFGHPRQVDHYQHHHQAAGDIAEQEGRSGRAAQRLPQREAEIQPDMPGVRAPAAGGQGALQGDRLPHIVHHDINPHQEHQRMEGRQQPDHHPGTRVRQVHHPYHRHGDGEHSVEVGDPPPPQRRLPPQAEARYQQKSRAQAAPPGTQPGQPQGAIGQQRRPVVRGAVAGQR